jgi:predicted molibdopterin-dependent oxidoreductase YjgC
MAEVLLPSASWIEKDGCFENRIGTVQCFVRAIAPTEFALPEWEIALRLAAASGGAAMTADRSAKQLRAAMSEYAGLESIVAAPIPSDPAKSRPSDMAQIDLAAIS